MSKGTDVSRLKQGEMVSKPGGGGGEERRLRSQGRARRFENFLNLAVVILARGLCGRVVEMVGSDRGSGGNDG